MSGRIETLTLEDVVARSTSIVRATGLAGGAFRVDVVLKGTLAAGEGITPIAHAAWRSAEWERIYRERGVRKIMSHPTYQGSLPIGLDGAEGTQVLLFLSERRVQVADGALESPAREADVRALLATSPSRPSA
jgi:hypothetical protein